ncbi:MAG: putative transcriptional regulator [Halobacteriales archaeon]|jgi:predicted transcriptional regulator
MSSIELTPSQQTILSALVNLYRESESAVKGEDIADEVDRNPGTIRNQMQSLKALQLVEGVPGPKGGYKPTATAYEALDIQRMDEPATVPLKHDGDRVEGANVVSVNLTNVHHPKMCRAEISVQGSIRDMEEGDDIEVGPTPLSKLIVRGELDGKDESANALVIKITGMEAPAETPDH